MLTPPVQIAGRLSFHARMASLDRHPSGDYRYLSPAERVFLIFGERGLEARPRRHQPISDREQTLPHTPSHELWVEVLADGLACLRFPEGKIKEEAVRWLLNNSEDIGSFKWICYNLNLSPEALRDRISRFYSLDFERLQKLVHRERGKRARKVGTGKRQSITGRRRRHFN